MGKRKRGQSHHLRREWTSLILFSVVPFATMEPVLNAACWDMKNLIGEAICRICQESFCTTITGMLICCCIDSTIYIIIIHQSSCLISFPKVSLVPIIFKKIWFT
ncbi:hypothetical protein Goshw_030012 [Gossypium schwendimanii]|uniref:Uncharacterized protein n=1 Tax=Gossypium schwendimanii TaxID=34291 RepID=A0A7J9KVK5_GOSSC|nr:hypothetical protein [Gossypium schwendimanii]